MLKYMYKHSEVTDRVPQNDSSQSAYISIAFPSPGYFSDSLHSSLQSVDANVCHDDHVIDYIGGDQHFGLFGVGQKGKEQKGTMEVLRWVTRVANPPVYKELLPWRQ